MNEKDILAEGFTKSEITVEGMPCQKCSEGWWNLAGRTFKGQAYTRFQSCVTNCQKLHGHFEVKL